MVNERQRVNVAKTRRVEGDGEVEPVASGVNARAVRAEGAVNPRILEPDLRSAAAGRDAPDRRLEAIGHVKVAVPVERQIVEQYRRGRIEGRSIDGVKACGIDALPARLDVDLQNALLFVEHVEVVL